MATLTFQSLCNRLQKVIAVYDLGAFVIRQFDADGVPGRVWIQSETRGYPGAGYVITIQAMMRQHGFKVSPFYYSEKHHTCIFTVTP